MDALNIIGEKAKKAARYLAKLGTNDKNHALKSVAEALIAHSSSILAYNEVDVKNAKENNMSPALVDRLTLTEDRIRSMSEGIVKIIDLDDPIGEVTSMKTRPNGLIIGNKRVPLGVVAVIYESRPNVTADAFGLTFKSGNAVILKGGSDAINSNKVIVKIITDALKKDGIDADVIQLITDTDRAAVNELMRMNRYVDVIIPRGNAGLIKAVTENSTIPVIETGTGNCHIFVDETADFTMALDILYNAKTQRIGVCNACESLIVHKKIAKEFIPMAVKRLSEKNVEVRGDEYAVKIDASIRTAADADWGMEYLDYIISLKTVENIDEAIEHINRYNTGHSESIITSDYNNSQRFLNEVDAAAVYVNASTRFTDGFEFGFGAEIGISTQKLNVRGPLGLKELTTNKYIIFGNGQVRP